MNFLLILKDMSAVFWHLTLLEPLLWKDFFLCCEPTKLLLILMCNYVVFLKPNQILTNIYFGDWVGSACLMFVQSNFFIQKGMFC